MKNLILLLSLVAFFTACSSQGAKNKTSLAQESTKSVIAQIAQIANLYKTTAQEKSDIYEKNIKKNQTSSDRNVWMENNIASQEKVTKLENERDELLKRIAQNNLNKEIPIVVVKDSNFMVEKAIISGISVCTYDNRYTNLQLTFFVKVYKDYIPQFYRVISNIPEPMVMHVKFYNADGSRINDVSKSLFDFSDMKANAKPGKVYARAGETCDGVDPGLSIEIELGRNPDYSNLSKIEVVFSKH